ncbi:MAG: glycosyltransferase [Chloroflexi bacterium]|nr:glycosyltransferase [Chloroflexota bacterium]
MTNSTRAVAQAPKTVAYVMSRFPKISETFILYEILELERLGLHVEVFPLIREQTQTIHAEAQAIVERAHYSSFLSLPVLLAQGYWLRKRPLRYLRAWWQALRGNLSTPSFLARTLVLVPQAALFARQMRELGVEHLHAHYATHPALTAYVVRELADIPYSFTAHAHDIYLERPMLDEKIRRAGFVVTISQYNRELLRSLYGDSAAEKTVVIHCGVDPAVFQPQQYLLPSPILTIVCVASYQDYKGHPYLIEACAQLKARGLDFRCLLIGQGEDQPQIEAQIQRLGLSEQVLVLGPQPRDKVKDYVAAADVIVLPSIVTSYGKQEGIPVALMEALASEKPVVATAISGLPELIEHERSGLLVPERDATALADALARLHDDPELGKRLGAAGRETVLREFDLKHNTALLHNLLLQDWSAPAAQARVTEIAALER